MSNSRKQKQMRPERFDVLKKIYALVDEQINKLITISDIQNAILEDDSTKEKTAISMLVSLLKKQKMIDNGGERGSYRLTQNGIDLINNNGYYIYE